MELERCHGAQYEGQKRMPKLPETTIRLQQIDLLDHVFNYHGFSYANERAAVLLRNWMAIDHSRFCDLYPACANAYAFSLQTIEHRQTLRQNGRIAG